MAKKQTKNTKKKRVRALDTQWFHRFESMGAFQAYQFLDGQKEKRLLQKQLFEIGEIENPTLDYPQLQQKDDAKKVIDIAATEKSLKKLKSDISKKEKNQVVKQVYTLKINEKLAELQLLRAVQKQDMQAFQGYSEYIYGKPSERYFSFTLRSLREKVAEDLKYEPRLKEACEELLDILPTPATDYNVELPDPGLVRSLRTMLFQEYYDILELTNLYIKKHQEEVYTAPFLKDLFTKVLKKIKARGWKVVVNEDKISFSVDHGSKLVHVPAHAKVKKMRLLQLIIHELGTHVFRRIQGEKSPLKLLALGLDRYEEGEEGVTTMREQVLVGEVTEYSGLAGHLAIGLAYGLDGVQRDFRQVYEVLKRYYYYEGLKEGKNTFEAHDYALRLAWARTVRTFRGTDCKTKGVCFTKDIIYREGNIAIWEYIACHKEVLPLLNIGKFDPARKSHWDVLDDVGIL